MPIQNANAVTAARNNPPIGPVQSPSGRNYRDLWKDSTDTPDPGELPGFLQDMKAAIGNETRVNGSAKDPAQVAKRTAALDEVIAYVDRQPSARAFSNINWRKFAYQLALRVRSPRIINQDDTTLCGPVALVYDIAKRNPDDYARCAISLFEHGRGTFRNGMPDMHPSAKIRNGYRNLLPEADYVVLSSVRDTAAIAWQTPALRDIFTLTKPGAFCDFLRKQGYTNIRDHTFLNMSPGLNILNAVTPHHLYGANHQRLATAAANLQRAAVDLQNGRFIAMNADAAVARALKNGTPLGLRPNPLPAQDAHWTAIRKLTCQNNKVDIKIITWGGSYSGVLPENELLSRYAGYVSSMTGTERCSCIGAFCFLRRECRVTARASTAPSGTPAPLSRPLSLTI